MCERYLILNIFKGYYIGIDYDIGEALFSFDPNSIAVLFETELDGYKRLADLILDVKSMSGMYKIEKVIIIS